MEKIKFIHAADLHLDSPFKGLNRLPKPLFDKLKESTFISFFNMIEIALREQVDFVCIAGDLFDEEMRSLKAQISLRNGFEKLAQSGISVFVVHGNHDHLGGSWAQLSWPENVYFFPNHVEVMPFVKNGEKLAHIYGFSYGKRQVTENMVKYYEKKEGAPYHIAMLHGNLQGKVDHDPYAPFTVSELVDKNFDYWALGHIHKQQILHKNPYIIYPGNLQGRHSKESGEKGCFIVEMDNVHTNCRFVPCASVVWEEWKISIDNFSTIDEFIRDVHRKKEAYRNSDNGRRNATILTIELCDSGAIYKELQDESLLKELCDILNEGEDVEEHSIWIGAIRNETTEQYDRQILKSESHFIGDLIKRIDEYGDNQYEEALAQLLENRKASIYLEALKDDKQEVLQQAERLLFNELLKEM
ncbi:metallophosphoesterase family protein [Calidifontibacillus erzurumensis]|uniref:metallophosphoesterase family protein n=1 Tax=Calidifontibacillus erzurumensis TaxID=2741433 RepID=UPI0035B53E1E